MTTTLLEKIQKAVPTATEAQLNQALADAGMDAAKVESSNGLMGSIVGRVRKMQAGGLAVKAVDAPIVDASAIATTPAVNAVDAPIASVECERDWATFNVRDLGSLTMAELLEFKAWRTDDAVRKALINEILGDEAATIAAYEESLQNQLVIAETNRRVIKAKAQVEFLNEKGEALDNLSLETGKDMAQDYFDRETASFATLRTVGKQTPTEGELLLLQARVVNRDRMNRANTIANTIAPLVKAIESANTQDVQTIDV
jgi:hypothetical protein